MSKRIILFNRIEKYNLIKWKLVLGWLSKAITCWKKYDAFALILITKFFPPTFSIMKFLKSLFHSSEKTYAQPHAKICPKCWEHRQYQKQNFSVNQDSANFSNAFAKAFKVEYGETLLNQKEVYYCRCCKQKYSYVEWKIS